MKKTLLVALSLLVGLFAFTTKVKAFQAERLSGGGFYSCALSTTGGVKCWGYNRYGEVGDGTTVQRNTPVNVVGLSSGIMQIASGDYHSCALTSAGGVKCWGFNLYGGLGNGSTIDSSVPVEVIGLTSGVVSISAGRDHTCAVTSGGAVKCWGYNGQGQLGDGTTIDRNVPVDVVGLNTGMMSVAVGGYHSCALSGAGGVKCWGENSGYELGDGTNSQRWEPVDVVDLSSGVGTISAGMFHTCALTTTGGVKCWGQNIYGALGDGANNNQSAPVDVVGLMNGVSEISATSYYSTCALTTAGGVKCWGDDHLGQLGDGSTVDSNIPVDVVGLASGVSTIAAGGYHACAISILGEVKCWGWNAFGQLADSILSTSSVPVDVSFSTTIDNFSPAKVWIGLKNSDDIGVKFDLKVEAYKDSSLITTGTLNSFGGIGSGFGNARLATIPFASFSPVTFPNGSQLKMKIYVRNACSGSGHNSGIARLWYNDSAANSQFDVSFGQSTNTYFLLQPFTLGTSTGSIRSSVDVSAGPKCSPFKLFNTWVATP